MTVCFPESTVSEDDSKKLSRLKLLPSVTKKSIPIDCLAIVLFPFWEVCKEKWRLTHTLWFRICPFPKIRRIPGCHSLRSRFNFPNKALNTFGFTAGYALRGRGVKAGYQPGMRRVLGNGHILNHKVWVNRHFSSQRKTAWRKDHFRLSRWMMISD